MTDNTTAAETADDIATSPEEFYAKVFASEDAPTPENYLMASLASAISVLKMPEFIRPALFDQMISNLLIEITNQSLTNAVVLSYRMGFITVPLPPETTPSHQINAGLIKKHVGLLGAALRKNGFIVTERSNDAVIELVWEVTDEQVNAAQAEAQRRLAPLADAGGTPA